MSIYERIFKLEKRQLKKVLEMTKYNPKLHEQAEKLFLSSTNIDLYSLF